MLTGLTNLLPETTLTLFDNLEFLLRILLSGVLGILVGLERSKRQKEAGVRTHCIIACTATVFMILSKYAFLDAAAIPGLDGVDGGRIAAQVVSGISFLGAGVIFQSGGSIRGLTTAAGMWGTAATGMAIGAGLYWVGLIEAAMLIFIQLLLHRFPVAGDALYTQEITVTMEDCPAPLAAFHALLAERNGSIIRSHIRREGGMISMDVVVRLDALITHEDVMGFLAHHAGIQTISV